MIDPPRDRTSPHSVTGLSAAYDSRTRVLHDVTLQIDQSEILAVLGPSGSGKSTLLRTIAGLHPLHAGRVVVGGRDVTRLPPERRDIGLVSQDGALFPRLSVAANIAYGLRGVAARRAASRPRVRELMELTDLTDLAERRPHELSGGQQQRVALARALAPRPRLMLLDEPFSALDAGLRSRLRTSVADILREQGVSTLLITHDQDEAFSLSDRVAVLRSGRIEQVDVPERLYNAPANAWVAGFVGDATLLPASFDRPGSPRTALGALRVDASFTASSNTSPGMGMYRAEWLELTEARDATAPGDAGVEARITRIAPFGSHVIVEVTEERSGQLFRIRRANAAGLSGGSRVTVSARTPGVLVRPAPEAFVS